MVYAEVAPWDTVGTALGRGNRFESGRKRIPLAGSNPASHNPNT